MGFASLKAGVFDILELQGPPSVQPIREHLIIWARHHLAGSDAIIQIMTPDSLGEPTALTQGKQAEIQQHREARDASLNSAFGEIGRLCESPSSAFAVFRAAFDEAKATPAATPTATPRPTSTPTQSATRAPASVTVSGTGTSAKKVTLPRGTYEVEVRWENNVIQAFGASTAGIIQVQLLNIADFGCHFLVPGELAAEGSQTHFCEHDGGELRIQVDAQASAEWSIRFKRD